MEAICECSHPRSDHRGDGLCEACMPPTDSTGRWSACQQFRPRQATYEWPPETALAVERARIRKELLEWLSGSDCAIEDWRDHVDLKAALDRICPEEE